MKKDILEREAIMGKIYMTACMKGGCAKTVTTSDIVLLDTQLHQPMRLRQEKIITFIM